MKSIILKAKKIIPVLMMLMVMSSSSAFASPPSAPTDVPFFNNLMNFFGFGVLIVSALIMGSMAFRWGVLYFKSAHEDDPAKLAEYDTLIKKAIIRAVLGLSGSIVGAILAFFV